MKSSIKIGFFIILTLKLNAQFQVNNSHTPISLVNNVLFNQNCGTTSNHLLSSPQNVGYFNRNNTTFPIQEGIIIRSGNINHSTGNYNPDLTRLSSQINSTSDPYLLNLSNSSGQTANITDTAFLQFDFNTQSSSLSFDFLFASNEYGQFQCGFSDVFAFVLTDLVTNVSTNLAVVPATTTPVSVKTIRDSAFNAGCTSSFQQFFGSYNVNNPAGSPINFRGQTVLLNASASLIPNRDYRIRLVIGDYNDSSFDSAIFISNGEFITYTDLGPDFSICSGNTQTLSSNLSSSLYTFKWFRNGIEIFGQTSNSYTLNQSGTYRLEAYEINGGCKLVDDVIVSELTYNTPSNVISCNTATTQNIFNLTINNAQSMGLNPSTYEVRYFKNNVLIPTIEYTNYNGIPNETINIRIFNLQTNEYCNLNIPIQLQIVNSTNATPPNNVILCQGTNSYNLTNTYYQVLNGENPNNYIISFHLSENEAQSNTNLIQNASNFPITSSSITIWIRIQLISNSLCFDTTSFQINLVNTPLVDSLNNITSCTPYVLPALTDGNYFTASNGQGTQLSVGQSISSTSTIYIFNQIPNSNCSSQSSFVVTIQPPVAFDNNIDVCSNTGYSIPNVSFGALYTGPGGTGTQLTAGTIINTTQTIHYYYILNGTVCADQAITINVIQNPTVTQLDNYISCLPYTLPPIANGNYFTGPNGTGTPLFPGDVITTTQTIYIFAGAIPCISQSQFQVTILIPEEIDSYSGCGQVIVPSFIGANFFTEPNGLGTLIPAGTALTTNQTIYLYFPNIETLCVTYIGTQIIINEIPIVDNLPPVYTCSGTNYVLPTLTNGNYTGTNSLGENYAAGMTITQNSTITIISTNFNTGCSNSSILTINFIPQLAPLTGCLQVIIPAVQLGNYYQNPNGQGLIPTGTVLTTSQTIYYFSNLVTTTPNCSNNIPVPVTIYQIPLVDDPADVVVCGSYTLPPLQNGNYYSLDGTILYPAGTVFTQNTTILIFNINGPCQSHINSFTITILNPNNFGNISRCVNIGYTIPAENIGNYYTEPNGQGVIIPTGTLITSSTTIYYFVATTNGTNCTTNLPINITIIPLSPLDTVTDIIRCSDDLYILPSLTNGNYFLETGGINPIAAGSEISQNTIIYVYNNANGCPNEVSFTVTITTRPAVASFTDEFECYSYTLPVIPSGMGSYYTESGGLGQELQPGTIITTTQTIYIFNPNPLLASCYGQTNFTVNIEGVQVPTQVPVSRCDSYTLPPLAVGGYFQDSGGINPIPAGTQITSSQTIYVYTQNVNSRGQICSDEKPLVITISITPVLPDFSNQFGCGNYQLPSLAVGNYYTEPNGQGTLLNAGDIITTNQTIHVYAIAPDNPNCIAIQKSFIVTIYPLRTLNINNGMICYDYTTNQVINSVQLVSGVNPSQYQVNWYLNNQLVFTGPNFTPTIHGTYTVSTVKLSPEAPNDCNYASTQVTVERSSPIVAEIITNQEFTDYTFLEIIVTGGYGIYEYQLNNGPFQSSPRFENVSTGYHKITIRDIKGGCNSITLETFVINYPKFFTPNNDGFNDTWNITDLFTFKEAKIHIFDRYGKFLKEIYPFKAGWDGRYNNQDMPASDYWFVVYYNLKNEDRTFKAHFSLKR